MRNPQKLFFVVLLASSACRAIDETEVFYPSYSEAREIVERGWIPDYFPNTIGRIHARFNLDTNQSWIAFELPPTDRRSIEKSCTQIDPDALNTHSIPTNWVGIRRNWWPKLSNDQLSSKFDSYKCKGNAFLIIERTGRLAYYWQ